MAPAASTSDEKLSSKMFRCLLYLSVPFFLVLTPHVLWLDHVAGHPPSDIISVASLLVSSYLLCWIASLTETMRPVEVLVRVSYLPLLSFFAYHAVRPFAGTALLYLNTLCAAGLCGYALAERRQRRGSDRSAAAAAGGSEKEISTTRRRRAAVFAPILRVVTLACAASVAWSCGDDDIIMLHALGNYSSVASACLFMWAWFVDECLLHGSLFAGAVLSLGGLLVIGLGAFVVVMAVVLCVNRAIGEVIFVSFFWLLAMLTSGLLGYTIAVYHRYKELVGVAKLQEGAKKPVDTKPELK